MTWSGIRVAERLRDGSRGFQATDPRPVDVLVAERRMKWKTHFMRCSATRTSQHDNPWDESHGYHHLIAPRWNRRERCILLAAVLVTLSLAASSLLAAESVISSKHNLSISGPGDIRATMESEICIFCHTPHRATAAQPLWNHTLSAATYTPYNSSTIKAAIGQPSGASKLCLSCHDGTVALGMVNSRSTPIELRKGLTTLPAGASRIGTDLSDDHPVSFTYDSALVTANGQLRDPGTLKQKVKLDHNNQMQCTSCHDPHNNEFGKFLVQNNHASGLCVECHTMNDWQISAHRTSNKTWNGTGLNPWPNTTANTVASAACDNCHSPHNAGTRPRLLTFLDEEQNCISCHSGNVAAKNIDAEFRKFSAHPIRSTAGVHDPMEDAINPPRHVECADCHNSHAANPTPAVAPNASGALAGLVGVNQDGAVIHPLTKQYEQCFRCHGDSVSRGPARVPRQFAQTNTRLEFAPVSASFHPVVAPGKNPNVPSLLQPLTASSRIYCTDCHNSDSGPGVGGSGPNGPHGSSFEPILERRLALTDNETETSGTYALCYKCHSRSSILADESFAHRIHVVDNKTSCATCHDPHGSPGTTHLINFNSFYVTPFNGRTEFIDNGTFRGNCTLTCHGTSGSPTLHDATQYGAGALTPSPLRKQITPPIRRRR
jgi:predicted CXXCH cytochrome family protein